MEQLGLVSEDEYLDRLRGAAPSLVEAELRNLLNLVTVTETCFFRDASQFRLLREHIIPTLMSERSARGCAARDPHLERRLLERRRGVFDRDHARRDGRVPDVSGLDASRSSAPISTRSAREGAPRRVYARAPCATSKAGCSTDTSCANGKHVRLCSDAIKSRVTFEFGNLTQTPMPSTGPQDIVFCKNVAIYFSADVTRKLIEGLHDTLAPDGYLLLGHAESLWQMSDEFTLVEHERAFCYRKSRRRHLKVAPPANGKSPRRTLARDTAADAGSAQYDSCLAAFRAGDWDVAESGTVGSVAVVSDVRAGTAAAWRSLCPSRPV